jgi:hypothetical protein
MTFINFTRAKATAPAQELETRPSAGEKAALLSVDTLDENRKKRVRGGGGVITGLLAIHNVDDNRSN